MADPIDKTKLTYELAAARAKMSGYAGALRHDLDIGARLKTGVTRNPVAWFAGAVVVGLVLSRIPTGHRKVVVKGPSFRNKDVEKAGKAATALAVLKFGLDFAKPAIVAWAKRRYFSGKGGASSPRR